MRICQARWISSWTAAASSPGYFSAASSRRHRPAEERWVPSPKLARHHIDRARVVEGMPGCSRRHIGQPWTTRHRAVDLDLLALRVAPPGTRGSDHRPVPPTGLVRLAQDRRRYKPRDDSRWPLPRSGWRMVPAGSVPSRPDSPGISPCYGLIIGWVYVHCADLVATVRAATEREGHRAAFERFHWPGLRFRPALIPRCPRPSVSPGL